MKRALLIVLAVGAIAAPTPVAAAGDGEVAAQVTVAAPCITVGPNIDYGVATFNSPSGTPTARSGVTSYTNCSSAPEQVYARGTDAVSTTSAATWSLTDGSVCSAPDLYQHYLVVPQVSVMGGVTLTEVDKLLDNATPAATEREVDAVLYMPCAGSAGAGETMTFAIVFTASF